MQLWLAALAAELRRALRALLPLRLAHRFPGEAVHFLGGRDGGAGSPRRRRRRRRRRHLRGPGAWQLPLRLARNGQRQEEEAGERRRGARAPPPRAPSRTALLLPGARRALFSPPADASRPHLTAGGSRSPPLGELPGAGGGGEGVVCEEVVDSRVPRAGGQEPEVQTTEARARWCGRRTRLSSLTARVPGRPARQHLSGHCQGSPPCLEPPPEALPSLGPSEPLSPPPALFPVSADPSSPGAVTRRPGPGHARARAHTHTHTNSLLEAPSGPDPLPHAPFHRPQRTPGERPLQLEKLETLNCFHRTSMNSLIRSL